MNEQREREKDPKLPDTKTRRKRFFQTHKVKIRLYKKKKK